MRKEGREVEREGGREEGNIRSLTTFYYNLPLSLSLSHPHPPSIPSSSH